MAGNTGGYASSVENNEPNEEVNQIIQPQPTPKIEAPKVDTNTAEVDKKKEVIMGKFNQWLTELEKRKSPEGVQMIKEDILEFVDENLPEQKQELTK